MSDDAIAEALARAQAEIEELEKTHGPLDAARRALANAAATGDQMRQAIAASNARLAALQRQSRRRADRHAVRADYRSLADGRPAAAGGDPAPGEDEALNLLRALTGTDADESVRPQWQRFTEPGELARPALAMLLAERLARHLFGRGEFEAARDAVERALEIRRRALPGEPDEQPDELLELLVRAEDELGLGGVELALDRALAALEAVHSAPDRDGHAYARHLFAHARLRRTVGDAAGARAVLDRALAADPEPIDADLALVAEVCEELGDLAGAAEVCRRMLAGAEEAYGPDSVDVLGAYRRLSEALRRAGDLPATREVLERALRLLENAFLPAPPVDDEDRVWFDPAYGWVGLALVDLASRHDDAAPVVDRLLALYLPTLDTLNTFDRPLNELVDLLVERGELALACATLDRVIAAKAVATHMYGPDHPTVDAALVRIAELQGRQGDPVAVAGTMRRLVDVAELRHGAQHRQLGPVLLRLGEALAAAGDREEAQRAFGRAMNVVAAYWGGPSHPRTCAFATDVGLAVRRTGDLDRAKTLLELAVGLNTNLIGATADETVRAVRAYNEVLDELRPD